MPKSVKSPTARQPGIRSQKPAPIVSIIVPVLNEARTIAQTLFALKPLRERGVEIVVVDGGSRDETPLLARPLADQVIRAPGSRAHRMNEGAKAANGFIFVFLRSDIKLPDDADTQVMYGRARDTSVWGRFDLRYAGRHALLPLLARLVNWYSATRGVATGDQAIFVQREAFFRIDGFADIPFMEDVELSKRLHEISPPIRVTSRVIVPGRIFDEDGFWKTARDMVMLRLRYRFGGDPAELAQRYSREPVGIPPAPEPMQRSAPPPRVPFGPRGSLPPDDGFRGPGSGGQRRR
jgi:rSAM/selenodomain-associated transferase 2